MIPSLRSAFNASWTEAKHRDLVRNLALRTGATLLPTAAYFRGRGHLGVCRPALPTERRGSLREDVTRITQLLAHELEALIRVAPEQWHLMQPNWPSDRAAVP